MILILCAATLVALLRPQDSTGKSLTGGAADALTAQLSSPKNYQVQSKHGKIGTQTIVARLQTDVDSLQGTYGIAVIDLTSGTLYGVNLNASSRAASVNKLPILVTLYQEASAGKVNLDQSVTIGDDDVQHYGTGIIQDQDSPRIYSLRELAALMIELSDNTAAYVLEQYVGQAAVQANLQHWGLKQTSMADNLSTPADAASLLANLYDHAYLSPQDTGVAITLLTHTVFTDRLQASVPAGVSVAHKIGTDAGIFNDAGLVLAPHHPYAIAVLDNDADENQAQQAYDRIDKDVYSFEASLPAAP